MALAVVLGLCAVLALAAWSEGAGAPLPSTLSRPGRWAAELAAYERQDREHTPPSGGIVFTGSSSIVGWQALEREFPQLPVIQRGFGGSTLAECVQLVDRLVLPLAPRWVVLYAGDNDLAEGATPEDVLARYQAFVERVHDRLPQTRIVFISIKASPQRARLLPRVARANALVAAAAAGQPHLRYVDVYHPMLGADGRPDPALFRADGLHPNAAGYAIWKDALGPHLN
jgi:lysophospholipase L1-like esterase